MARFGEITFEEVLRAGRVIFGATFRISPGWKTGLKAAYRRRALETHPDRARALGRTEAELAREFHTVTDAYRVLASVPPPSRSSAAAAPANASRTRPASERGPVPADALPRRRIRFAEFLYFTGRIPWSALVEAVAWQRRQRPVVGRIAIEFGFLGPEDVDAILARRRADAALRVPFGEYAVRHGYLSRFQLLAILGRQRRFERPIGRFFVERGVLAEEEIEDVRAAIFRHNARWAA